MSKSYSQCVMCIMGSDIYLQGVRKSSYEYKQFFMVKMGFSISKKQCVTIIR